MTMNAMTSGPRLVLIDDDPTFSAILKRYAEAEGLTLAAYDSLVDLGGLASLSRYDVVLLDFALEHLTGVEIAAYLDAMMPNVPAILISADPSRLAPFEGRAGGSRAGPRSVRRAVAKAEGPEAIISAARELWETQAAKGLLH